MDPFVLLDDASHECPVLLSGLRRVDEVGIDTIDDALASGFAAGWHCFAWLPYDLGESRLGIRGDDVGALYWFASRAATHRPAPGPAWVSGVGHDVDPAAFAARVAAVQEAIAAGSAYQVNLTHRITGRVVGDPVDLYWRLRDRQPVAYGVLAHLPGPAAPWTLSLSPELFLRVEGGTATASPMKGTAHADTDPEALRSDPKNRAENLMIVDLLRNDLSRVAVPGTVAATSLFEVERVGQLWQMTGSVRATLEPTTTPGLLLGATFPCGSITGAPKLAAMTLIRDVEGDRRGLYTGALGLIRPTADALGWSAVLSVAIRTAEVDHEGRLRMGVGSGIVADSDAAAEWAECEAKAAFLSGLTPDLVLIETLRVVDGAAPLAGRHAARLRRSAEALGFPDPGGSIDDAVSATPEGAWRLRLTWDADGHTSIERTPLPAPPELARILIAGEPWRTGPWSSHKSSHRPHLDAAWREAEHRGAFDIIGHDGHGRVLEGGRCSVFALLDGVWTTPPTSLGVLPGVQRSAVLDDPSLLGADAVVEAAFTVDDLLRAERIVVTNAVAGVVAAVVERA